MSRFNIRPFSPPDVSVPESVSVQEFQAVGRDNILPHPYAPKPKRKYTRIKPYRPHPKRAGLSVTSPQRIRCDKRAIEIYNAILSYYAEHGMMPTIRELNDITSANSTSMVNYYLQRLEAWGWIRRAFHSGRAIQLLRVSEAGYMRSADGTIEPVTFEALHQRYLKGKEQADG